MKSFYFTILKKRGVSFSLSKKICAGFDINLEKFPILTPSMIEILSKYQKILNNNMYYEKLLVNFLKHVNHIKGRKYIFKLPVRGQRTHTNSRTAKRLILGR